MRGTVRASCTSTFGRSTPGATDGYADPSVETTVIVSVVTTDLRPIVAQWAMPLRNGQRSVRHPNSSTRSERVRMPNYCAHGGKFAIRTGVRYANDHSLVILSGWTYRSALHRLDERLNVTCLSTILHQRE